MYVFTLLATIAAIAYWQARQKRKSAELERELLTVLGPDLRQLNAAFDALVDGSSFCRRSSFDAWQSTGEAAATSLRSRFAKVAQRNRESAVFLERFSNGAGIVDAFNEAFVAQEAKLVPAVLKKHGIPFNDDQLRAIVTEEDNVLLVAGAGTGKTTTIEGKAAYLVDRLGVPPEEILLLSFTKKATGELVERVRKIANGLEIKTFHAFGLSVIGEATGRRPDIAFEGDGALQSFVSTTFAELLKDPAYAQTVRDYFAYFLKPEPTAPEFETLDEYYAHLRLNAPVTIKKEKVRSTQEAMIANFLFLNGIRYEYERPYEVATSSKSHRQYKPDFYLPDYKTYLEHFGVDRKGNFMNRPSVGGSPLEPTYAEQMEWKRDTHRKNKTRLIETFSYEFSEGTWREALTKKLAAAGIALRPKPSEDILAELCDPKTVSLVAKFVANFITLFKSGHASLESLWATVVMNNAPREAAFFKLFRPLYEAYERHLKSTNAIDYDDMLGKAAELIAEGKFGKTFRYVIVDEYQDISVSKFKLVAAVRAANPGCRMYCVGDDWQSIYRFAGSDVSLMSKFSEYFGHSAVLKLEVSNRFSQQIAARTNEFVQRNPLQIKKKVRSGRSVPGEPMQVLFNEEGNQNEAVLSALDAEAARVSSAKRRDVRFKVFLLGRYGLEKCKHVNRLLLGQWGNRFKRLDVEYLTAHSSKGLTADFAIIQDANRATLGIPCEIVDDPLLGLVLNKPEPYPFAEERRVMYVALTRARHKVWLLADRSTPSPFIRELVVSVPQPHVATCPECRGRLVIRSGPHGAFTACSNFPLCDYTSKAKALPSHAGPEQLVEVPDMTAFA